MGYNQTEAQNKCKQEQSVGAPCPLYTERHLHTQRQNAAHCSTHYTLLALELQARRAFGRCTCPCAGVWDFSVPGAFLLPLRAAGVDFRNAPLPLQNDAKIPPKEVTLCAVPKAAVLRFCWCFFVFCPAATLRKRFWPPPGTLPAGRSWKSLQVRAVCRGIGLWCGWNRMAPVLCCGGIIPRPR